MQSDDPQLDFFAEHLEELATAAVRQILKDPDSESFLAWMQDVARRDFDFFDDLPQDEAFQNALTINLGRALWNATPLPDKGFRPDPLPEPGRNQPCPCGSGKKFKRCCRDLPSFPFLEEQGFMGCLVARELPTEELERFARARTIPGEAFGYLARTLLEEGQPQRVLGILEPLFEKPQRLDGTYEMALDSLFDAYDDLGLRQEKLETMNRLAEELRPPLRGAMWSRTATMAADKGHWKEAWQCFGQAQQDDPDNPSIALLEVTLLLFEGRFDQASERARFWHARLRRLGYDVENDGAFAPLEETIKNPREAALSLTNPEIAHELLWFREILEKGLSRPVRTTRFETWEVPDDGPGGLSDEAGEADDDDQTDDDETFLYGLCLEPPRREDSLMEDWAANWPESFSGPMAPEPAGGGAWYPPEAARAWLEVLNGDPEAFDRLSILDDLCQAVRELGGPESLLDELLMDPILERGAAILERTLEEARKEKPAERLLWGIVENRPGLRLLEGWGYTLDRREELEATREVWERLLRLNPMDNQGVRDELVNLYLRTGDDEAALELAETYAQDAFSAQLAYGPVLALFRLGRRQEAAAALARAVENLPHVADYLAGRQEGMPELRGPGYVVGGEDQAWFYLVEMEDVWQEVSGLLEWLERETATS